MQKLYRTKYPALIFASLVISFFLIAASKGQLWPPGLKPIAEDSPVLSPEEALKTFFLPPGYQMELVASEPLVEDPVAIDFDADGRIWVAEMRGFMPNVDGEGETRPVGRIVVLEDLNSDGRMDRSTIFLDSLVLPRAVRALDGGVLVGAPPYLWMARDTTGNFRADVVELIRSDYGDPNSNPDYNPNGLMWGMDNWIHSAFYAGRLRNSGGTWEYEPTLQRGQWGISQDDYGRIYRSSNEDPLRVDLIPAHYYLRNPNLKRTAGVYERAYEDKAVWPVRPTPGVNRGYRDRVLRDDGRLARHTSAGAPTVFRGHRLPEELLNNVFVAEPAGNLVHRYVMNETDDGRLTGRNPYYDKRASFLASTDERFRPVNLYSAPDGTLYVVDMYRGVIEHRDFMTDYLKYHIRKKGLEEPLGLGRIYRIVHRSMQPSSRPQLSQKSSAELVEYLSHPNGWWRDTAHRLIVERSDQTVVPLLRQLTKSAAEERTRLHALWVIEGLGQTDPETLLHALSDHSPHVRAAALRISEPLLQEDHKAIHDRISYMIQDEHPVVRRQIAASLGQLPVDQREAALANVLAYHGNDPIVVDVVISGLHGGEVNFLDRLLNDPPSHTKPEYLEEAIRTLAEAITNGGEQSGIQRIFALVADESRPRWQRLALLDGIEGVVLNPDGTRQQLLRLNEKPAGLLLMTTSAEEEIASRAASFIQHMDWPGKPGSIEQGEVRPLTPEEQRRFEYGRVRYETLCASCHRSDGKGMSGIAPRLIGSKWVLAHPRQLTRILLQGLEGDMLMPPVAALSDEEIAAILTYIRRAWGHEEPPVEPDFVREIRGETTGRNRPWSRDELEQVQR